MAVHLGLIWHPQAQRVLEAFDGVVFIYALTN